VTVEDAAFTPVSLSLAAHAVEAHVEIEEDDRSHLFAAVHIMLEIQSLKPSAGNMRTTRGHPGVSLDQ
jgi:hypothetical protein